MKPISSKTFWQTYFGFGIFIGLIALYQTLVHVSAMDVSLWHSKWTILLLGYILTILGSAFLFYRLQTGGIENFFERLENIKSNAAWRWLVFLPLIAVAFVPPLVKLYIFGRTLPEFFPLLWVFWWICLFQVLAWKWATSSSWAASFASVVLIQVVAYQVYENLLVVTTDPFSIDYSETSRFYYGSLWLSQSLYGMKVPLSPWHATRYILMAIPYLIRGLPLWAHRTLASAFMAGNHQPFFMAPCAPFASQQQSAGFIGCMLELCLSSARAGLLLSASLRHHYPVGRGDETSLAVSDRRIGRVVLGGDERCELVSGSGGVGRGFISA